MNYTFLPIHNLKYKGYDVFYKKLLDDKLMKAFEFNNKYNYFYIILENKKNLGKFIGRSKVNLGCPYNDIDYDILQFENDFVYLDKSENIYCLLLVEEIMNNMISLDNNYTFEDLPLFYKKTD